VADAILQGKDYGGLAIRNGTYYFSTVKALKTAEGKVYGGISVRIKLDSELRDVRALFGKVKVADTGYVYIARQTKDDKTLVEFVAHPTLAGKTLEGPVEELFRSSPLLIVSFLVAFGLLLALSDTISAKHWKLDRMDLKNALLVGLAQCLALMPGVSRSGITITVALFLGYNRETAARFSFLLSLPIVAGAGILKVGTLLKTGIPAGEGMPLLIGIASSAIFGYLSVALLLRLVQRHTLYPFVWYRLLAGAGFLVYFLGVR